MNIQKVLELHSVYVNSFGVSGTRANLRRANLSGADLSGANLRWADLRGANLRGANLRRADLSGADLSEANLSGTNLRGADLRRANLSEADLSEANLSGADLSEADLSGANLRWANLPDKTWVIVGERYFVSITNGEYLRAGCQCHTVEDWRNFTKSEVAEMDGKAALKFYPRLLDILDFYLGAGERPDWVK